MSTASQSTLPKLIGLYSSVPGSGKSTVSHYLAAKHGYKVIPFAETLKLMIHQFLLDVGIQNPSEYIQLYKQNGFGDTPITEDLDPEIIASFSHLTPRYLCQTLGTEWGRHLVHQNVWLLIWAAKVKKQFAQNHLVCVDDCRFPNEYNKIVELDGQIWNISRPSHAVDQQITNHTSEGALDHFVFDVSIINNGSIDDLYNNANLALHSS
jgi:hypothetical protein